MAKNESQTALRPALEWMDKPIESKQWTNLSFLKDGRCLKSKYILPSEAAAKKHAEQSEAFLADPVNGPLFKNEVCGTIFGRQMYSHTIQIPVKP